MDEHNTKFEKDCQKEIMNVRHVYRVHLTYVVIICAVIMVCTLCVIPNCVSENAFQNFSFASTIVSIVLAVVSIVYSLWSGQKSNNQYMGMVHIESKIDEQLKGFERIEESFTKKLNPINEQMAQIKDNQTQTKKSMEDIISNFIGKQDANSKTTDNETYNADGNPYYAELTLYTFAKAFEAKKTIPSKQLTKLLGKYWSGFIVAISRSQPERLNYEIGHDNIKITKYDAEFFGKEVDIRNRLINKKPDAIEILNDIDEIIGAAKSKDDNSDDIKGI